jgi:two-component system, chemotaxis family, sensor kinase Cph1
MTTPIPQQDFEELREALESEQRQRAQLETCLRRSRADFQEFTSRVAHDLREPLRTVGVYSLLVSSKAGEDEDARLYLAFLQDAVERMQALLGAMIEYASVEGEPRHPVSVDMNAVTQEALRRIDAGSASITRDPLPAVSGDFDLLTKVMRHLIENALKFAGRPDPSVHISAQRDEEDWVISVADNGPGIDPSHHEFVFGIFRRLHGRDFKGTGLGLAFSKSAVESLGGHISVQSTPGNGATFFFKLPSPD